MSVFGERTQRRIVEPYSELSAAVARYERAAWLDDSTSKFPFLGSARELWRPLGSSVRALTHGIETPYY